MYRMTKLSSKRKKNPQSYGDTDDSVDTRNDSILIVKLPTPQQSSSVLAQLVIFGSKMSTNPNDDALRC